MLSLPDDVLVEFFKIYTESDTPLRLIRVCRRWHAIATGISSLWSDILFYDLPRRYTIRRNAGKKLICYSASSLASSIARVKGNKFELTVIRGPTHEAPAEEGWKDLQPSWFSHQCRALRLPAWDNERLVPYLTDLSALEELEIRGFVSDSEQASIASLLGAAAKTSKRLRYLSMPRVSFPLDYTSLLGRVARLHIQLNITSDPVEVMKYVTSATSLTIDFSHCSTRYSLDCPSPFLDTLFLKGLHWVFLAPAICSKLKNLTIEVSFQYPGEFPTLELPNLTQLTVSEWWTAMLGLRAPKLQILKLQERHNQNSGNLSSLFSLGETKLRPIKLDLDLSTPENKMEPLIRELCGNIEELQVVYKTSDRSLWRPLASSLRGGGGSAPLCPGLKRLVILSPKRSIERQKKSEDLLRGVKDAFNRVGKTIEVRYGWYEPMVVVGYHDPRNGPILWTTFTD
jgi:hypothetical protein